MADQFTKISTRTVVSTKPVQPGKYYPLSVLDRIMEQNHLRIVYYYETPPGRTEAGETTKKLRESLSEMLNNFPIVSGRLTRDHEGHWVVKCNDAGLRIVETRAKGSVQDWLKNVHRDKELQLVHWEDMYYKPYFWSTFQVQVTEFEEGGFAIGLSCIHLMADPTCAAMFIHSWAATTLHGKMINPPLFHPLPPRRRPGNINPNHKPYNQLINYYKSIIERTNLVTDKKYATLAVSFSDPMVQACITTASFTTPPDQPKPSPFEALSALFWVCLSKLKGLRENLIDMSIFLDMRHVLGLDKGFFGNCMVYNKVIPEMSVPVPPQHELAGAAKAIGEVRAKMDNNGIMDLIEWLQYCSKNQSTTPLMNSYDLICGSLECVDPYLAMFEDGFPPIHASYYVEPVIGAGQVLILPSRPDDGLLGRVVMVALPQEELAKICEDELFLSFSPTILMRMGKN